MTLKEAARAPLDDDLVLVRKGSGGVFPEGTTNHLFSEGPPSEDAARPSDARAPLDDGDHALHFDPTCEECVYLARPQMIARAPLDVERLARLRKKHRPSSVMEDGSPNPHATCVTDQEDWPCDVAALAAEGSGE